jgi:hypothetical protein
MFLRLTSPEVKSKARNERRFLLSVCMCLLGIGVMFAVRLLRLRYYCANHATAPVLP